MAGQTGKLMSEEEKYFLLSGIDGSTDNYNDLQATIDSSLQRQQIKAFATGIYTPFSSHDVGLGHFIKATNLGLVRLSGEGIQKHWVIKIDGNMKLQTIPEEIMGWTEVQLKCHVLNMIPNVTKELSSLCQNTGVKVAVESDNSWLVGDSLQVSIARNHLNAVFSKDPDFIVGQKSEPSNQYKIKILQGMFSPCTEIDCDLTLHSQSLADLCLAFYVSKNNVLPEKSLILPGKDCTEATVIVPKLSKASFWSSKHTDFDKTLSHAIQASKVYYGYLVLPASLRADFRSLLENIIEEIHRPILFIKSRQRFWSCYIFSRTDIQQVQEFVDEYLKVNTPAIQNQNMILPRNLPSGYLGTRKTQLVDTKLEDDPHVEEKKEKVIHPDHFPDTSRTKLCKYPKTVSMKPRNMMYLCANKFAEIQKIGQEHDVHLVFDKETIDIEAATESVAEEVYHKLNELQTPESIHSTSIKRGLKSHKIPSGNVILECVDESSLYITGPKATAEALKKVLENGMKTIETKSITTETERKEGEKRKHKHVAESKTDSEIVKKGKEDTPVETSTTVIENISIKIDGTTQSRDDQSIEAAKTGSDGLQEMSKPTRRRGLKSDKPPSKPSSRMPEVGAKLKSKLNDLEKVTGTEGMKTFTSRNSGVLVQVGVGDITTMSVDAIVNAANEDLDHVGGVAFAIAEAAGPGFDEECQEVLRARRRKLKPGDVCVTGAGDMPSKNVLHAVGPSIGDYDEESECFAVLRNTFYNCLIEARKKKLSSLAIPAISSGVFGVPNDKVAEMACEALEDFIGSETTSPLQHVIFTDIREEMIALFEKQLIRLLKKGVLKQ